METITLENCPWCNGIHTYNLNVERSIVIKNIIASDFNETKRPVRVTRIFICPKQDKEFQGTLTLYDTSSGRIKSITVIGVKND